MYKGCKVSIYKKDKKGKYLYEFRGSYTYAWDQSRAIYNFARKLKLSTVNAAEVHTVVKKPAKKKDEQIYMF
jgi:hypothetical protein